MERLAALIAVTFGAWRSLLAAAGAPRAEREAARGGRSRDGAPAP
jgi:hypothetical protein